MAEFKAEVTVVAVTVAGMFNSEAVAVGAVKMALSAIECCSRCSRCKPQLNVRVFASCISATLIEEEVKKYIRNSGYGGEQISAGNS